jgi:hypothetical protein
MKLSVSLIRIQSSGPSSNRDVSCPEDPQAPGRTGASTSSRVAYLEGLS